MRPGDCPAVLLWLALLAAVNPEAVRVCRTRPKHVDPPHAGENAGRLLNRNCFPTSLCSAYVPADAGPGVSSFDSPGGAAARGALAEAETGPWSVRTLGPFAAARPVTRLPHLRLQGSIVKARRCMPIRPRLYRHSEDSQGTRCLIHKAPRFAEVLWGSSDTS